MLTTLKKIRLSPYERQLKIHQQILDIKDMMR